MCGIVGAFALEKPKHGNVVQTTLGLYGSQKSRGSQGFGAITMSRDTYKTRVARSTVESDIVIDLKLHKLIHGNEPDGIVFHHRYPTSTDNTLEQTHPFFVSHETFKHDYYIVHNGVISNDSEIKPIHDKEGFIYQSLTADGKWNDSETCAIELAKALERKNYTIKTLGSQAIVAVSVDKKTKKAVNVYLTTNGGNPMKYALSDNAFVFASELSNGTSVKENELVIYSIEKNTIKKSSVSFVKPKPVKYTVIEGFKPKPAYQTEWYRKHYGNYPASVYEKKDYSLTKWKADDSRTYITDTVSDIPEAPEPFESELDDIDAQVSEYITLLSDPLTAGEVKAEHYGELIKSLLEDMRAKALVEHNQKALTEKA